ncbi:MAG: GcrA cell cycle regulator [Hyphomicrobiales bacterium]|nr:GcrA cell cycle regulator [Hyphomicrobiales bacterium]
MSWTEERVTRLTKLWSEGLSASQVAAELGGVTRNAVIGKIHRLGLSGRDKPASKSGTRQKRTVRANGYSRVSRSTPRTAKSHGTENSSRTSARNFEPVVDLVAPEPLRIKLVNLTESTCKWPLGDPQEADFSFCGHSIKTDTPYCEYHCKLAYQPITERRRVRRTDARN